MLIALNVEDCVRGGAGRMLSLFRRNRVRVEHLYCDSAAVRSVVYERRRGRVSWASVERFLGAGRSRLLCPPELTLPDGWRRFSDPALSRRMCENAALFLLRRAAPARVRTVLIDPDGSRTELCGCLADETDSLRVVTAEGRLYLEEADRILEERGAVVRVCAQDADLSDADLIVSPCALRRDVSCHPDAVILSGEPTAVRQNAPVVSEYIFDLPDKLRSVKPAYLDDMYFASALYALGGVHGLGSEIFRRCCDGQVLHTRLSLLERLRVRLEQRKN